MNNLPPSFEQPRMINISDLVGLHDRCFYVPLYQRPFSWEKEDRQRFLEDMQEGLGLLAKSGGGADNDALTFLGSMISYQDKGHSILPRNNGTWDLPSKDLCGVIDGQQRITMLMLFSVAAHDYIRTHAEGGEDWLQLKAEEVLQSTSKIFQVEKTIGGQKYYYPRMIREGSDVWSRREEHARYESPLSHYIHEYGEFARDPANASASCLKKIKPLDCPDDTELQKQHKDFVSMADEIVGEVAAICDNWPEIPEIQGILENRRVMETLFLHDLPRNYARALSAEKLPLAQAIVFASYTLHRVYFVAMETTVVGFAFDIFQSLNTTGQELTAYETFKPDVVKFEKDQGGYKNSLSAGYLGEVDRFLNSAGPNKREMTTSEMLIAFALSETGEKLARKIRMQQRHMRDAYKDLPDAGGRREFSRRLMQAAMWLRAEKGKGGLRKLLGEILNLDANSESLGREVEEAEFCLDFISASSHKISRGLLLRFYQAAESAAAGEKTQKCLEWLRAIKAAAAFFALLRSVGGRSSRVEQCHRGIMEGVDKVFPPDKFPGLPFCRKSEKAPNLQGLQAAFRHYLAEKSGVECADDWVQKSMDIPLYEEDKNAAKFVVMVASHDTEMDAAAPGCVRRVNPEVHPNIIDTASWKKHAHQTVEHIVPQSRASSLRDVSVHCMGNLTLLPRKANNIIGAREWPERKAIYFALSAKYAEESAEAEAKIRFLEDDEKEYLLADPRYLPMTRTLAFCENFAEADIKRRHRNLAKLAWGILGQKWLGFKE